MHDRPTHCKDCKEPLTEDDHGMCLCGAFYCSECGGWGHASNLGSVAYHEHDGRDEPWGIAGTKVN